MKPRPVKSAAYWLTAHGIFSLVLYNPEHLPRNGTMHIRQSSARSKINQESIPQACLQTSVRESVEVPYYQTIIACVTLTKW